MILSGFGPLPKGLPFSLNFLELQGVRIGSIHITLSPRVFGKMLTSEATQQVLEEQEILPKNSVAWNTYRFLRKLS